MNNNISVRAADGGYIITLPNGNEEIRASIEDMMDRLLLHFLGLSKYFSGSSYGKVRIEFGPEPEVIKNNE